jgi:hypothetical protein
MAGERVVLADDKVFRVAKGEERGAGSRSSHVVGNTLTVAQARDVARQWVLVEASGLLRFHGAFYAGSTNWLAADAAMPTTSDVDLTVVLASSELPERPGTFRYRNVILDVSYASSDRFRSPNLILGDYHLAGSFRAPNLILDRSGRLNRLQAAVSRDYARREWVYRRCDQARAKVLSHLGSSSESEPVHDQVTCCVFAAGVTTHVLLSAGLRSPTVRRRYVKTRELLADYGYLDFYDTLLEMLGCAQMSRARVEAHLSALTAAFDSAARADKTPFFFASEISEVARPLAIDGSRELIERGLHREAVFWIVATYSRCRKILQHDAAVGTQARFDHGYRELLGDLGIASYPDLQRRNGRIERLLPSVWEVAEAIMAANRGIEA